MEWAALLLSLKLAIGTMLILLPIGIWVGRKLAWSQFRNKYLLEALLALPLVLPPTVLGFYLLLAMGAESPVGRAYHALFGQQLTFSFAGLLLASLLFNLPFAIQPMQRAFEAIPREVREAARCCGLSPWRVLRRIELPLAWPGILSAMVLTFAHTLGEFGVVLMVGGSIPGETRTIAIAIYDRVQAFDEQAAGIMSAVLLLISLLAIGLSYFATSHLAQGRKAHD
ncbi:molybdate ABC transporter permease subunit [Pseudomonas sp. N040]|uniref:molybdate ABC transporter permease subunit n=1 Tax=Pseudomonas sp. N040 TaxID=2785325 RepID=UPI0018A2E8C7|nr:molybdate ABC transporter permease subunit [Pseudomonas sp. N040]MBF7729731.1 molybdate ABC transporter permease subunit [Pseudomonas sp. N040]MBW7013373.1 molybdate ABC transporter permease subunit [Pseudomonas sp. N040]